MSKIIEATMASHSDTAAKSQIRQLNLKHGVNTTVTQDSFT